MATYMHTYIQIEICMHFCFMHVYTVPVGSLQLRKGIEISKNCKQIRVPSICGSLKLDTMQNSFDA